MPPFGVYIVVEDEEALSKKLEQFRKRFPKTAFIILAIIGGTVLTYLVHQFYEPPHFVKSFARMARAFYTVSATLYNVLKHKNYDKH